MFKSIKRIFVGDDDHDAVPEAVLRNPENPQFEHLSNALNYAAWDDANELFYLDCVQGAKSNDLGAGFIIELNPLLGADDEVMLRIMSSFQTLPQKVGIQISILGSPIIDDFLTNYAVKQSNRLKNGENGLAGELFASLAKKRVDFWRKGTFETLFPGNPMRFREFRAVLSINIHDVNLSNKHEVERVLDIRQGLIAGLESSGLFMRTWGPNDLLAWSRNMLNPERMVYGTNRELADEWDEMIPLRDQMISPSTFMRVVNDGRELRFGRKENNNAVAVRCLSVAQYPSSKPFHLSNMGYLIGDPGQVTSNYTCPFLITINIIKGDFESNKAKATMKSARATQNASSPMAKMLPEFSKKAEDWKLALEAFEDGSGGTVELFHVVTLFDTPERITSSENAARSIWQTNGFALAQDQYIQMQSYLSSLPMALDEDMIKSLNEKKRFTTKTMINAVALSPVIGEWCGLSKRANDPVIGLFGPNGQAMSIDLFANPEGNYNAAVVGTSGSGKSFFLNEFMRNYLGAGGKAWVIDVGRSYQKLCEFLGGQYLEFNTTSNIVINPFDTIKDFADELTMLTLIFSIMIAPNEGLTDYQLSRLQLAITNTWHKHGQNAQIDDLQTELFAIKDQNGDANAIAERMAEQLYPFTSQGIHGKWFNGKSNLDLSNDFVVLEMEELASKPDLQQVIMRFIMFRITQEMYLFRDRTKICLIDEAWKLLAGGPGSGAFIEDGYRRARKYEGSFMSSTQSASDYERTPAALAALANSDWIFVLRGKDATIETLKKQINLSPTMVSKIRSLRTVKGQYSDVFVYCGTAGYGVGKLVSDPYNALLSSSRAEDFEAIREKQALGMPIGEAVGAVLVDRGILVH